MEGIRLRSDSTGSAKSAFYQGKIGSTIKNANRDVSADESSAQNNRSRRGLRSGPRQKDRTLPPEKKTYNGIPFHLNPSGDVADGRALPVISLEVSSPPPPSPFAPPSGYYCQDPRMSASEQHSIPKEDFRLRSAEQFMSSASTTDRSSQSFSDFPEDSRFPSIPASAELWLTGRAPLVSHRSGYFLEESPSMDDTELQGVSLDLDHSPMPSPNKSGPLFDDEFDFHPWSNRPFLSQGTQGRYSVQPPGPPPPFAHSIQYGSLYQHPSYGTTPPLDTSEQGYCQPNEAFTCNAKYQKADSDIDCGPTVFQHFWNFVDLSTWLTTEVRRDEDGNPQPEDNTKISLAAFLRLVLYNSSYPEFTSLQQFSWAVILGIGMGILTAVWKALIESCVEFVWKTVPETLLGWGVFSDLDGIFPVYHYMWITPSIFGGTLSYIFAALPVPIPGQNDWIHSLHSRGVQDSRTFVLLFVLSTAGMASGLSLGPELPLILTSGMIGSSLGVLCKQSILSARVLNLTAASAAIGGFFGFPMAGALFVLEVPHRMGLQYFEALSPATIASIVAVLTNRLVTGNDVTGYYQYPFLNESLPSSIFHDAIAFGLFGGALGIVYTRMVLALKTFAHDLFHNPNRECHEQKEKQDLTHVTESTDETSPLMDDVEMNFPTRKTRVHLFASNIHERLFGMDIGHEPTRAGVVGAGVGIIVGVTCMFFPHVMFWGESQLQNLIDKGRTPLPVFGHGDEPSAGLVSLGLCMVDRENGDDEEFGFSLGCSAAIAIAKIFVTGLSLGTGIVGGHFWAPLFVGCAASHFLTDSVAALSNSLNVSISLSAYPCVAVSPDLIYRYHIGRRSHI
jgi:H+/Cl- antiporter ClcA